MGNEVKCHPIIIHKVEIFVEAASPDPRMRVMTEQLLDKFKSAVKAFAEGVAHSDIIIGNTTEIQKLLVQHRLNGKNIIDTYTVLPKK